MKEHKVKLGGNRHELHYNDIVIYVSYSTPVAMIFDGKVYLTDRKYSRTTSKHVTQWLNANHIDRGKTISVSPFLLSECRYALYSYDPVTEIGDIIIHRPNI